MDQVLDVFDLLYDEVWLALGSLGAQPEEMSAAGREWLASGSGQR